MAKIPSPYFSPSLPEIVTCNGFYVTRQGEVVEILQKSEAVPQFFAGRYSSGVYDMWHKSGRMFPSTDSDNDIISSLEDKANEPT